MDPEFIIHSNPRSRLGALYDCVTGKVVADLTLWPLETIKNGATCAISIPDTYDWSVSHTMETNGSTKLIKVDGSLNKDIVDVNGKYEWTEKKTTEKEYASINLTYKGSFIRNFTMDGNALSEANQDIIQSCMATHVITGIEYGINASLTFTCRRNASDGDKTIELVLGAELKSKIPALESLRIGDGTFTYTSNDKNQLTSRDFAFTYSGISLPSMPNLTLDGAIEVCRKLPEQVKEMRDKQEGLPLKIWIFPLFRLLRQGPMRQVTDGTTALRSIIQDLASIHDVARFLALINAEAASEVERRFVSFENENYQLFAQLRQSLCGVSDISHETVTGIQNSLRNPIEILKHWLVGKCAEFGFLTSAPGKAIIKRYGNSDVTLTWEAPAHGNEAVLAYMVLHRRHPDRKQIWDPTQTDNRRLPDIKQICESTQTNATEYRLKVAHGNVYTFVIVAVTKGFNRASESNEIYLVPTDQLATVDPTPEELEDCQSAYKPDTSSVGGIFRLLFLPADHKNIAAQSYKLFKKFCGHRIAVDDNAIYVIGGWNRDLGDEVFSSAWKYHSEEIYQFDIVNDQWTSNNKRTKLQSEGAPFNLTSHRVISLGSQIPGERPQLLVSGWNGLAIYDVERQIWRALNTSGTGPKPSQWYGHAIAKNGNHLYVATKLKAEQHQGNCMEIHRLDLISITWEVVHASEGCNENHSIRIGHEIVVHDNKVYILGGAKKFGGDLNFECMKDIPFFDMNTRRWGLLTTLPDKEVGYPYDRYCFGCAFFAQCVYIVGGLHKISTDKNTTVLRSLWRLDLSSGQWTRMNISLPYNIMFNAVDISSSGVLYIVGGIAIGYEPSELNVPFFRWRMSLVSPYD